VVVAATTMSPSEVLRDPTGTGLGVWSGAVADVDSPNGVTWSTLMNSYSVGIKGHVGAAWPGGSDSWACCHSNPGLVQHPDINEAIPLQHYWHVSRQPATAGWLLNPIGMMTFQGPYALTVRRSPLCHPWSRLWAQPAALELSWPGPGRLGWLTMQPSDLIGC